jgi:hypothetical protein
MASLLAAVAGELRSPCHYDASKGYSAKLCFADLVFGAPMGFGSPTTVGACIQCLQDNFKGQVRALVPCREVLLCSGGSVCS